MSVTTPQHHRVGAHRARRNPVAVAAIGTGAIVALSALLVWGLFATGVLGGDSDTQALEDVTSGAAAPSVTASVPAPSASAPVVAPPSVVPTTTPSVPAVDQTATITVLNGGVTVSGVARASADSLVAAGWTGVDVAATANAPTFPDEPVTLVTYADPALQATAEALVVQLGQGTATPTMDYVSAGFLSQIVVVLGADFVPPA